MVLRESILIFSAYKSDNSTEKNKQLHEQLIWSLNALNIPHKSVIGRWNWKEEQSVVISSNHRRIAEMACRDFNQECYLECFYDRHCQLVYADGSSSAIGRLTVVPENEALKQDAFTYDSETKQYFVCR